MIVCIAEKPSVARDIARIIGATTSHQGYMEGNGYQVTWTFGHLCELKMPEDYTPQWKAWSLSGLPMLPERFGIRLKDDDGVRRQFAVIERLMQQADSIVNCGDAGQEGELIQRWVMQKAKVKCPVRRLWISSMTDEAIREGFAQLKEQDEYHSLYMAGLSRAVGDWVLGINATRLYTIKYGQPGKPLSVGRVQTPTLAMIVNRQKEIDHFVPVPYWVLATVYRGVKFTAMKGEFHTREEGEEAFSLIKGKPFFISKVEKKDGKESPKPLYDLTSLQVDCNRKLSLSAETTLNIIQSLYERKLTTYPRVDTQYLSEDVYPKCGAIMNGLYKTLRNTQKPYSDLVRALSGRPLKKTKRVFDDSKVTDHHAIVPTGVPPHGLTDVEWKVYDLIARRFIAAFYPDCKFATTAVQGQVKPDGGKAIAFKANGKTITEQGWRSVYAGSEASCQTDGTSAADNADATDAHGEADTAISTSELPPFAVGENGPHKPTLTEKKTTPPKHFTEATLLRAMETAGKLVDDEELRAAMKENGIGRPSTRAAIIETLFRRGYIKKERKRLVATPLGMQLIDLIKEELLKSPELTGRWEKKLREIEHQRYDARQFIEELKQQVSAIVLQVMADNTPRTTT